MKRLNILCVLILLLFTGCQNNKKEHYTDTPSSGVIAISVDESFQPIIQQEIQVFEAINKYAGIVPKYTNEVDAINLLLNDSVRMTVATRRLSKQEIAGLEQKKLFPKEIKIATDGIALIVNKQNKDTLITTADLKKIITGEVTQWSQLYPKSKLGKLQLVFDNTNSSTVRYAIDSICREQKLSKDLNAQKTNQEVINYVAQTPNAIGVIGVSWLWNRNDSTNLTFLDKVNVMSVSKDKEATADNSYKPYQAYLALGQYPLVRDVYILITDPRSGLPSGFTTFISTDRGQRIILRSGIVPATQQVRIVNVRDNL